MRLATSDLDGIAGQGGHPAARVEAGRPPDLLGDEHLRAERLVQRFDARGDVHHVADDRVLLAVRGPDVAHDRRTRVKADADARGRDSPLAAQPSDAVEEIEPRLDRRRTGVAVHDRCAEDGHEAVTQELVDDAVALHDGVDRLAEDRVEVGDDVRGASLLGERREVADVEEHHAHLAELARDLCTSRNELVDDLGRHVLPEDAEDARALLDRLDGAREALAEAPRDEPCGDAGDEEDERLAEVMRQRRERRVDVHVGASRVDVPQQGHGGVFNRGDHSGEGREREVETQRREQDEEEVDEGRRHQERLDRADDGGVVDDDERGQARLDERVAVAAEGRRACSAAQHLLGRVEDVELEAGHGAEKQPHWKAIDLAAQEGRDHIGVRARDREEREHRRGRQDGEQRRAEPLGREDLLREPPLEDFAWIIARARAHGRVRRGGRRRGHRKVRRGDAHGAHGLEGNQPAKPSYPVTFWRAVEPPRRSHGSAPPIAASLPSASGRTWVSNAPPTPANAPRGPGPAAARPGLAARGT